MDNTAYIDDFLEGRLSPTERTAFEMRLKEDPSFAAEFEIQWSAYALVTSIGLRSTKEKLQLYEVKKYRTTTLPLRRLLWAAAAIFLLTITVWFLMPSQGPVSNDQLFSEYFTAYRDPVMVRGDASPDDIREKANNAYRQHDYATAENYYAQIANPTTADKFYYGLSALSSNDDSLAISLLKEIGETASDYAQQARWYLALAYIKNGNKADATKELEKIVNEKAFKHIEAKKLDSELNN